MTADGGDGPSRGRLVHRAVRKGLTPNFRHVILVTILLTGCRGLPEGYTGERQAARLLTVPFDTRLLTFSTLEWSPSGRRLVICDLSAPRRAPQVYDMTTGGWSKLPLGLLRRQLPSPPRELFMVRQVLWLREDRLACAVTRFQSSEDENAEYLFEMGVDGSGLRRLAATQEDATFYLSPDRKRVASDSGRELGGEPFGWARLKEMGYWQWVIRDERQRGEAVADGSFTVDVGTGSIRPPSRGRSYLWEVGGLDATELLHQVGRQITDVQYLPRAGKVAFRVLPRLGGKDRAATERAWDAYRERGRFEFGFAPLSLKSWQAHMVRLPRDLRAFGGYEDPEGRRSFRWAADGRYLFARHRARNELWTVERESSRAVRLAANLPGYPIEVWPSPDGSQVALVYGKPEGYEATGLALLSLHALEVSRLSEPPRALRGHPSAGIRLLSPPPLAFPR